MSRPQPVDLARLGARARAQIAAQLAAPPRARRRSGVAAKGDTCSYRCADCGNVESPSRGRGPYALTRATKHADLFDHHRIEVVLG